MKVTLEKNYKEFYSINDLTRAKKVIAHEKDDESTPADYLEYAVNEIVRNKYDGDYCNEVLKATATTTHNYRVNDLFGDDTGDIDVWIEGVAKTGRGFIEVGAYLSDIWNTGATPYAKNTYHRYYRAID